MVSGDSGHPRKLRAGIWWAVAIAAVAASFAALVILRMPQPDAVEPQPAPVDKQPVADQPAESIAAAEPRPKQTELPAAETFDSEPAFDFDARRFSVELTLTEAAAIWPELFGPDVAPQSPASTAVGSGLPELTPGEWHRWLELVDDETATVAFEERSGATIPHLHGMLQLRCPWPRDGVLRFTPVDSKVVALVFWNGTQGTALVYHPHAVCDWAAYRLERAANARRPGTIALAFVNTARSLHAEDGEFAIHQQGGQLIVVHDGKRLFSTQFDGPPQSVYVLGESGFRGFGMDRRTALPEAPSTSGPNVTTGDRPTDLDWTSLPADVDRGELSDRFEKLAWQSADRGDSRAFGKYSETLFTLPVWLNQPIEPLPVSLVLAELVPLVDADLSDDVARICRSLRFWNQPSDPAAAWPENRLAIKRLVEWAEQSVNMNRALLFSELQMGGHPWILEPGRDALSPALGLATALADSAIDDACRFITETPLPTDAGLVPDSRDAHLAVYWPQAIRNALHDEPRLAAAMQSGFSRLGELRLSRAVAVGDVEAVRAASIQFLGTQIVAEACLELGDRNLALGRFNQALSRFQSGLRDSAPEQADRLEQRVRLAASCIGMDLGRPTGASVSLGEKNLTAEQFESLLAAQRRRAASGKLLPTDQLTSASATAPPPGRYELRPITSWQLSTLSKSGEQAITGDRVHVAAQGTDGIFVTGSLGAIAIALQQPSVRWSLPGGNETSPSKNAQRMASAGDRLFWAHPTAGGLELTCVDSATGAVKWQKRRSELPVISNPVWSQKQLLTVAAYPHEQGVRRIALCELNPEMGETISQTDIGALMGQETTEPQCALAAIDDRLILATAAGVMCCDREGRVHWLQRSTWLPPEIQGLVTRHHVEMALFVQSNAPLIVLQPGVAGLQAYDLETGRRVWQRAIPDIYRIVGLAGGLIVAQTPRGLLAFQFADGAFAWQRELPASSFTCGLCDDGQVITGFVQPDENGKQQLVLQWLARDGRDASTTAVDISEPHVTSLACFASIAGRFFVIGYDKDDSAARLLELVNREAKKP